ncbi:hemagglutinin repeat-containing protein [Variovorax robiniae]|uniref:Hemagglutinin repeat-containing protein n=1 Tax=Variovorax robiniae TaxID=1836199 RepID=A0ABU8XJD1_9BURK
MSVNTHGAAFDNTGDQTLAIGDLTISAGDIANTNGLIRSTGTTTLNAATVGNTGTQGADRGIEGKNVAITADQLDNTGGAIRADVDTSITSGGTVNNTSGVISALNTLTIADPNAANPNAKTLQLVNTNGTLTGTNGVDIDTATFSADGKVTSGKDLRLAVTQDIVNNGELSAIGSLNYSTTGNFSNNGKLSAGDQLTIGGSTVENGATGEMSATNGTTVNAGTLNNRGLIDSNGQTRINATTLNNLGTGRIYGDDVSISTNILINHAETVNGITSAADLFVGNSLLTSGLSTSMAGATVNNDSASIESLGNLTLGVAQVNNVDSHIEVTTTTTQRKDVRLATLPDGKFWDPADTWGDDASRVVYHRNADGSVTPVGFGGWGMWYYTVTTTGDIATHVDPASLTAGGDISITGTLYNRDSHVIAGGAITAGVTDSRPTSGTQHTEVDAFVVGYMVNKPGTGPNNVTYASPQVTDTTLPSLGGYAYEEHASNVPSSGSSPGAASGGGAVDASASATGAVQAGARASAVTVVGSTVGEVAHADGASADAAQRRNVDAATGIDVSSPSGAAAGANTPASRSVPMVVRTSTPKLGIPQVSLFRTSASAGSHYLVETDPRFANYRTWLSSDYLLQRLGMDPNNTLKRLGDGFYEQRLIREQVAQLTGYRYLEGFSSDEAQYTALMNNGATFAQQYGLRPGIALTPVQMAQLTSDIVWLVEQTVTLADGSTQQVLVPQLYVRVRPGDIDSSGALLSADTIKINSQGMGDLTNSGTIAGRSLVDVKADTINNLGGRISGGSVLLDAQTDLNNIGGSISADNAALLNAGRDLNIQSTTQNPGPGATNLDRVAGVYLNNPGGLLVAMAGRDVNLTGVEMTSAGMVAVDARRDLNVSTVSTSSAATVMGEHVLGSASQTREIGSVIQGSGNVQLSAARDINIRASGVQSTDGALGAVAGNDINVTAGRATTDLALGTIDSSKGLLKKTTTSTFDSKSTSEVLSSSLSGNTVDLVAGRDLNAQAARLRSDEAMNLTAVRDINLTTADQTSFSAHARQSETKATGLANHIGMSMGPDQPTGAAMMGGKGSTETSTRSSSEAIGTTVSTGSLSTLSGRDTTLQGATVVAEGNVRMEATRNLTIESAQNSSTESGSQSNRKTGMVGTWYNPAVGHVKGFEATTSSSTTQASSQVASLQGNVDLIAGENYRQTASSVLAAGNAGPLAGGDVNIKAKNVLINEADNTEQSMRVGRTDSSILGGSASVGGISTDTIQGAVSSVRSINDTQDDRMKALGVANLAMSGKQVYDAAQSIASGEGLGFKVSVNVSRNTSESTSFGNGTQAVGSGIVGANNVSITATGAGENSSIRAVGSTITAGNTVSLAADNDVTLEASKNTQVNRGNNASHGASVGVGFAVGSQNGFTIDLGVSKGLGNDKLYETTYNNTHVSGGKEVDIHSGGDLTLKGAVVDGEKVKADVGGNLAVESLQDVSVGSSKQTSGGLNVSLCIPPICYGISTASGNYAAARASGVFIGANEQSGIKAGDQGFEVDVKGDTTLKGSVIESTQAAIDDGKNSFTTGGSLTMSDLQNASSSKGSAFAVSGSEAFMAGGKEAQQQAMRERGYSKEQIDKASNTSTPPPAPGYGSTSSSEDSTMRSGISGIAGDQSVRTGDSASSTGVLVKDWNTQAILKDVQGQAQITQQFGQQAPAAWGKFADGKFLDAVEAGDEASAACWGPDGPCRAAGHALVGALSGGSNGALGAGFSSVAAPHVQAFLVDQGFPPALAVYLTEASVSGAVGAIAGGHAAAGAFNETANNSAAGGLITTLRASPVMMRACVTSPACVRFFGAEALAASAGVGIAATVTLGDVNPLVFGGGDASDSVATLEPRRASDTGNRNDLPSYGSGTTTPNTGPVSGSTTTSPVQQPGQADTTAGGGYGAGGIQSQSALTYSVPPSILDGNGALPPGIGGVGTPIPMPASADPNQTAEDFAKSAFNGQTPASVQTIGNGWVAKLPDGTVVVYRPAGQANRTDPNTASVDINSPGVQSINNGRPAKFKFPRM